MGLSAAARSDLPSRERLINSVSRIIVTNATTASMPRALLTKTLTSYISGPISHAELDSGVRIEASTEPNTIRPPFCRISAMPSVRMSWA